MIRGLAQVACQPPGANYPSAGSVLQICTSKKNRLYGAIWEIELIIDHICMYVCTFVCMWRVKVYNQKLQHATIIIRVLENLEKKIVFRISLENFNAIFVIKRVCIMAKRS